MQCTRVPLAAIKTARRPGLDFIEPRIGSTGVDAQPFGTHLSSPPDSDSRHLLKCPLRRSIPTENGVALRPSITTDSNFGVGRHRALPEVGQSTALVVPTYRR